MGRVSASTPGSLTEVVATGDRRRSLEALRDHLAAELEHPQPGIAIAPIAKELRQVIAELDGLPTGRMESKLDRLAGAVGDELAARRATRQPDAASS